KLLFDGLPESSSAVINKDDPQAEFMLQECKAKTASLSFKNESSHLLENSPKGISLVVEGQRIESPLVGTFNAYNVGEAFLICKELGLNPQEIADALKEAKGAAGRMETIQTDHENLPVVIVDYAHTPDALSNVLSTLVAVKEDDQHLTVVFGAGGDRDAGKRPKMARAAAEFAEKIIVTSDNPRTENPDLIITDILDGFEDLENVKSITDRKEAIEYAISEAASKEIILIAGKGHEDYQEVNGKRHHFDDREIALDSLTQKSRGGN
ncbi:MAG TPA: UDP-N-acetylmuramoyl-L-alanyl-D-glutamate--2,6-diaminopimelate ligase, partial [Balneolaceae bacterium]|nr:UDP-N-acetylmuramoyl-L-alanyl-D-glutamate--2,6-diaminopimelate ligase [Balneolaceae bacterium]